MFLLKTLLSLQSETNKKEAALATSVLNFPSITSQVINCKFIVIFIKHKEKLQINTWE